jgi:hypothetical protein
MSRQRMRQDQQFWHIVKDLRWKLEDNANGMFPSGEPEFGYGVRNRSGLPRWASHVVAFLLGGLTFALALVHPVLVPIMLGSASAGVTLLHWRKRR